MVFQCDLVGFVSWYNQSQAYTVKRVIPTADRNNYYEIDATGICHTLGVTQASLIWSSQQM